MGSEMGPLMGRLKMQEGKMRDIVIRYKCEEISRLSRLLIKIPILGYLGVFGVFLKFGGIVAQLTGDPSTLLAAVGTVAYVAHGAYVNPPPAAVSFRWRMKRFRRGATVYRYRLSPRRHFSVNISAPRRILGRRLYFAAPARPAVVPVRTAEGSLEAMGI